jgi:transposase
VQRVLAGESPEAVIRALGFHSRQIYRWLALYRSGGWNALKSRKASGRPKTLTARQIQWVYDTLTMKNPLQRQLPFGLWTRGQIQTLLYRKFGVRLSLASIGRLLAQLGLTCQKPLFRAFQENPSLVERWLKKEYPRIRAMARKARAEVFFGDESGVRSDFHSGTTWAWAPRGKTPVVRVTGQRFSLHRISAVCPRGSLRFMIVRGGVGARAFIRFLKRLMHGMRRPVFLIVDGHPSHRAKIVTQYGESLRGRLRLFFLPPYSPELNPDELVWNEVKNNGVGRMRVKNPVDRKRAVVGRLRFLQKNPAHVRTFFQSPDTRYAA